VKGKKLLALVCVFIVIAGTAGCLSETDEESASGSLGDAVDETQSAPESPDEQTEPENDEAEPEEQDKPDPDPGAATWTTFFYVAFDNNIGEWESWATDLHYLEEVGSSEQSKLVALVDEELDGDTRALEIHEGSSTEIPLSDVRVGWGDELNMGDPDVLFDFLAWGTEMYPAEHYDVHLMDHGGAWMGVCGDDTSGDFLDAWEIADALADVAALIGRKIDIVSCDACLMGSFEFGYEISDSVSYLTGCETYGIGSQKDENVFYTGNWLYDQVWGGLKLNPDWTPEEFALHHLDCFQAIGPFKAPDAGIVYTESSDTFVVADLTKIAELKEAVDTMAVELLAQVDEIAGGETVAERELILSVIGHSETPPDMNTESFSGQMDFIGVSQFTLYDLGDFTERLSTEPQMPLCSAGVTDLVMQELDRVVVGCVHGDGSNQGEHPDAHGLTIYIPYRSSEYQESYESTRFARESSWDEFIKAVPWGTL